MGWAIIFWGIWGQTMNIGCAWTLLLFLVVPQAQAAPAQETLSAPGLNQPVEILKDHWGVSHIYAKSEDDLFFAQGFVVAQDRLFQMELWKRSDPFCSAELSVSR